MDPATAFQVALGAFQLAQICYQGAKTGYQIYKNEAGLTDDKLAIQDNARLIEEAAASVKTRLGTSTTVKPTEWPQDQRRLLDTCDECAECASSLCRVLKEIQSKSQRNRRDALKAWWRNTRKANEIEALRAKIDQCRNRLDTDLLVKISAQVDFADARQRQILAQADAHVLQQTTVFARFEHQFRSVISSLQLVQDQVEHGTRLTRDLIELTSAQTASAAQMQAFKTSLSFEEMNAREDSIQDTFSTTFEWIFHTSDDSRIDLVAMVADGSGEQVHHGIKNDNTNAAAKDDGSDTNEETNETSEDSDTDKSNVGEEDRSTGGSRRSTEDETRVQTGFAGWLTAGQSIFWINGKAGSGKSTLMKFIAHHSNTTKLLTTWANGKVLVMPRFFFWSAGTRFQRSITGMLRSVILQLLVAAPQYTVAAVNHVHRSSSESRTTSSVDVAWTFKTLSGLLLRLTELMLPTHKICLLLDGLDEFEGDFEDREKLTELVHKIARGENIKILLSSRPEPHLLQAFGPCSMIRLQDLTSREIHKYAKGRLAGSNRLKKFVDEGQINIDDLAKLLCDKADGVFLWIALAVRNLGNGLLKHDTVSQLYERLQHMEDSLHGLFGGMLRDVDEVHRPRVALWLNLVIDRTTRELLNRDDVTILELAAASDPSILFESPRLHDELDTVESGAGVPDHTTRERLDEFAAACLSQSAGLLDIADRRPKLPYTRTYCKAIKALDSSSRGKAHYQYMRKSVRLVHRSALEFLQSDALAISLLQKAKASQLDIDLRLIEMHDNLAYSIAAMTVKQLSDHLQTNLEVVSDVLWAMEGLIARVTFRGFLIQTDSGSFDSYSPVLKQTNSWLVALLPRIYEKLPLDLEWCQPDDGFGLVASRLAKSFGAEHALMLMAVEFGLHDVVYEWWRDLADHERRYLIRRSLIVATVGAFVWPHYASAARRNVGGSSGQRPQEEFACDRGSATTVEKLLASGADPNTPLDEVTVSLYSWGGSVDDDFRGLDLGRGPSIWDLLLTDCRVSFRVGSSRERQASIVGDVLRSYLRHGASLTHPVRLLALFAHTANTEHVKWRIWLTLSPAYLLIGIRSSDGFESLDLPGFDHSLEDIHAHQKVLAIERIVKLKAKQFCKTQSDGLRFPSNVHISETMSAQIMDAWLTLDKLNYWEQEKEDGKLARSRLHTLLEQAHSESMLASRTTNEDTSVSAQSKPGELERRTA